MTGQNMNTKTLLILAGIGAVAFLGYQYMKRQQQLPAAQQRPGNSGPSTPNGNGSPSTGQQVSDWTNTIGNAWGEVSDLFTNQQT